jgi:hypothetical protein
MHPDLAIALYRHQEHTLEVRLEHRRANLEALAGRSARTPRRHLPHLHRPQPRR